MELLHPLYALHSRPYRETSLLMRIFHRDMGIFSAVAKGGAGSGELQAFQPFCAKLSGKSELKTLYGAENCGSPFLLPPASALCGLYINELLLATCAEYDSHPALFKAYEHVLESLVLSTWPIQQVDHTNPTLHDAIARVAALRNFEWILLRETGYEVDFTKDAHNQPITQHHNYTLLDDWLFHLVDGYGYQGKHLLSIANNQYDDKQTRQQAKKLSREMISRVAGKKLNSWKLFD